MKRPAAAGLFFLEVRSQVSGLRFQGSGFRVQVSSFKFQISSFKFSPRARRLCVLCVNELVLSKQRTRSCRVRREKTLDTLLALRLLPQGFHLIQVS